MNHQLIREQLLTDDPLTEEQSRMLAEHLAECENCQQLRSAWSEVHQLIIATPKLEPMPGFLGRWETRLAMQRKLSQQRVTWLVFGTLASIAMIIMILLGFQIFEIISSPQQIALVFLSRVAVFVSYFYVTKDYVSLFSAYLPDIPLYIVVLASGFTTLLCVLWLLAIKKISTAWRAVK